MKTTDLTIEAIVPPNLQRPVHTERFLNSLSDTEWAELRALATRSRRAGQPALLCGDCRGPVYARESAAGRRHCYHFGTELKDCRWSSANAKNFGAIDASKFGGNQEGERHKQLKAMICEILNLDPATSEAGVTPERYTKGTDGNYAFPDVYATSWQGGAAAFEIQLATTQLPTIIRREDFYAAGGIRLCWMVGGDLAQLERRTFKDIYLRNDGQILGVDGDVLAAARSASAPRFRLFRLLPGSVSSGFQPIWRHRIVAASEIDWGVEGDRPKSASGSYDSYLDSLVDRNDMLRGLRAQFYLALKSCDEHAAGAAWDQVAEVVGGMPWEALGEPYNIVRALGVLASIRRNEITVKTKIEISNLPHLANSLLLEPKERRWFSHAFKNLSKSLRPDLLDVPSIAKKVARNLADSTSETPIDARAGPVFNAFFPEGAFQRLQL